MSLYKESPIRACTALLLSLSTFSMVSVAVADTAADPMARDIKILSDWFGGEFDNEEQVWFENDPRANVGEDERVKRIHTIHQRVEAPQFGDYVFYVEEYVDNDPEEIIRQRLVIFTSLASEQEIRMQQGFFKDSAALRGAYLEPERVRELAVDQVAFIDSCDVYWRRHAGQFRGSMRPRACVFGEGADRRYSVHDLTLSANKYWRVDTTFRVSDDSLFIGYPVDRPMQLRRAKRFDCAVHFYAENGQTTDVLEGLSMHDQGGLITVQRPSDQQSFEVLMRQKEYPYYETRPDFIYFSIRRAGERRSIAFSVNDPDSRQVGMRTQEIGAFCHRVGYAFLESTDILDSNR